MISSLNIYQLSSLCLDPVRTQDVQDERRSAEEEAGAAEEGDVHELPAPLDRRQYAGHLVLPGQWNITGVYISNILADV